MPEKGLTREAILAWYEATLSWLGVKVNSQGVIQTS